MLLRCTTSHSQTPRLTQQLLVRSLSNNNHTTNCFTTRSRFLHNNSSTTTDPDPDPSSSIKLRFAPSPTGFLHLGGLRTVLYNYLLAKKYSKKGKWVLRIEDTDQQRYVKGSVESLLKTLKWAGLDFDQGPGKEEDKEGGSVGPYFQSQRSEIYNKHLEPLLNSGKAYHCFCTPERLTKTRKMLQKQRGGVNGYDRKCLGLSREQVEEKLNNGEQSISSSEKLVQEDLIYDSIIYEDLPIEDFVLRKSDGLPTYHFANVIDDYEMGITHVLRGEEWLPSTPKHLQLYKSLNLEPPKFAHLPLMVNPDGSKLSKRTGDVKVEDYIEKGYEPDALLNFVALLGWSPQSQSSTTPTPTPESQATDLLSVSQLIEKFSLKGINKNRPTLQQGKLDWLNRNHIKMKLFDQDNKDGTAEEKRKDLANRVRNIIEKDLVGVQEEEGVLNQEYLLAVVDALKDRLHTIKDIPTLGRYFFLSPDYNSTSCRKLYKSSIKDSKLYREVLSAAIPIISSLPSSLFSRSLSLLETPTIEQQLLVSLSSISIVTPSPSQSPSPNSTSTNLEGEGEGTVDSDSSRQKASQVMSPLRHCLTGQKVGSSIASTVRVLGREETLKRLKNAIESSLKQEQEQEQQSEEEEKEN
ncbi:hypothetical protein JCM3765_003687 [Sporobolomyces pararoseus]